MPVRQLKSAREREIFKKRMKEQGEKIMKDHWEQCKEEGGEDGLPFSMRLYGQNVLKEEFKGHSVLHRV